MVVNIWKTWLFRGVLLVLFAALLFYILFLANGYQYDRYSHQIRKTGIIDISYADPEAKVFLDGTQLIGRLPFVASNVLPGIYTLVIGREGFLDYSKKVSVEEDLISVVGSAFLYPMDVLAASRLQLDWDNSSNNIILAGGYIFRQLDDQLDWAKLRDDLSATVMREAKIKPLKVSTATVLGKEVLLQYSDDSRQILDMFGGETKDVDLAANYVFGGDRWFYFHENLLAAFDRNLGRVIWAKKLSEDDLVESLRYWETDNRQFLLVGLKNNGEEQLFEIKGGSLIPMIKGKLRDLLSDSQHNLYYVQNETEIWKWVRDSKAPQLLARFSGTVRLWSVDLSFFKNDGVVVFEEGQKFYLADLDFENVREMFPRLGVSQLQVIDHNKVFYLDRFKKAPEDAVPGSQRLLMLNLEK